MQPRFRPRSNLPANSRHERRSRSATPCRHCGAEPDGNTPQVLKPCPNNQCPAQLCGAACLQRHLQLAHPQNNTAPPQPVNRPTPPRRRRAT